MNREHMLGEAPIGSTFIKLAAPAIVAQVVNLLYNIVDRIYIGHIPEVGAAALTGVGLFTPILTLINAFAMLAGSGGAPRASICMGRGDRDGAEQILGNCFSALLLLSVVLTIGFYVSAEPLLRLFGASDATIGYATEYSQIYILGTLFILLILGLNPYITAQGAASVSMSTIVIGATLNIILDPIFIFVLDMGVRGAAIATVLSQAVSAGWILRFLTGRKSAMRLRIANMRIKKEILLPCLALGISTFVMLSTESLLSISFNTSLARYGGDLAVGAMTIITSVSQMVYLPISGICQGGQPLISYNYGAKNAARVRKAFRIQFAASAGYSCLACGIVLLLPRIFTGFFTTEEALLSYTSWAMRIYMAGAFAMGFQVACQQAFLALGQAKISLFLACLRKLILLIPLIFLLPQFLSNQVFAVFLAEPVSDIVAAAVTTTAFLTRFKGILSSCEEGQA